MAPLKHVLNAHRRRVISESEEDEVCSRIFIVRTRLWQNALKAFKRPSLDVSKHIKVVFIGEPAEYPGVLYENFSPF